MAIKIKNPCAACKRPTGSLDCACCSFSPALSDKRIATWDKTEWTQTYPGHKDWSEPTTDYVLDLQNGKLALIRCSNTPQHVLSELDKLLTGKD